MIGETVKRPKAQTTSLSPYFNGEVRPAKKGRSMKATIKVFFKRIFELLYFPILRRLEEIHISQQSNQVSQKLLSFKYQELSAHHFPLPKFEDVEFRAFSQNGEDGILLYIFSLIGTTNKQSVEMCVESGIECNTANLAITHGWKTLMFDGNKKKIMRGKQFYQRCPDTMQHQPILVQSWITTQNVNSLIRDNGFDGEIDLFSLDMDGVDYWIWKAIDCIQPRVVVLECNATLGPYISATVPYKPDFQGELSDQGFILYGGASLLAFTKLAAQKGYRLVGCQSYGLNAFFVRNDIGSDVLPEVTVEECLQHPYVQRAMQARAHYKAKREWVEV